MSEYKWISQDKSGRIERHHNKPIIPNDRDYWYSVNCGVVLNSKPKPNWRDSLINLETHDYKIEDGILMQVEKQRIFKGSDMQFKNHKEEWIDCPVGSEYRIKPKTVKFRMYAGGHNHVYVCKEGDNPCSDFNHWLGDWQEVEIEE